VSGCCAAHDQQQSRAGDTQLCSGSGGAEDLHLTAIVAFQQFVQLPGDHPLQAPPDLLDILALGGAPRGVDAGLWVVAPPCDHDGVQGAVELPVTGAGQPVPGDLP